jgi:hypothetical protein
MIQELQYAADRKRRHIALYDKPGQTKSAAPKNDRLLERQSV